jgi:hypothetical protein
VAGADEEILALADSVGAMPLRTDFTDRTGR